jgi:hypothetical protein
MIIWVVTVDSHDFRFSNCCQRSAKLSAARSTGLQGNTLGSPDD